MSRLFSIVLILSLFAFTQEDEKFLVVRNTSFDKGEELDYMATYSIFTVAKASILVDKKTYDVSARKCYKVDAEMETLGVATWFSNVDDQWGAYVDTAALVTHRAYRKLKEGKYRKDEVVNFDHDKDQAEVKVQDEKTGIYGAPKYYPTINHVRDVLGGFLYLRVLDFRQYAIGDTITISGFFEDTTYHMKIIYAGKEIVKLDIGHMTYRIPSIKLTPVMPDNSLFDGANSITAWISDDGNKIPIKVKAKMFIGSFTVELSGFRGLRNQLKTIR